MTVEMARNVDVVPTMLYLLGQPYDPEEMDGKVIPEILEIMERQGPTVASESSETRPEPGDPPR